MSGNYPLHDSIGYRMTLMSRISERRFETLLAPLGLTRVTWCVLLAVGQQDLHAPSAIAEWIGIDRTATSRALKRLDAAGLVDRCNGTDDKRNTVVSITQDGATVLAAASAAATQNAAYFNDKLSWYERDMLTATLEKLLQNETRNVPGL